MLKKNARTLLLVAAASAVAAPAAGAYPGTNGGLAFTSNQDGARHIFITRSGGIVDLTGTSSAATDVQPKFSPDGREILFTRSAPGLKSSEIFVMSASGAQPTRLTNTAMTNGDATWSPNGTQIAFVSFRNNNVPQIFIMRSDGTGIRQITHDNAGKAELAWSPAANRIAFVRTPPAGGDREIYSINTNGTGLTDLSHDPGSYDVEPAWSPDGSQIAYSGPFQQGSVGGDLWIMDANGTNPHPLVHEDNGYSDGGYPAWSPDGTAIAFAANNGSGYYHVWEVPATGGQNTEVVANKVGESNPQDLDVDWRALPTSAVPRTRITAAAIKGTTARFSFIATGPATGYRCELRLAGHRASFTACASPRTYKSLKPGSYTFSVIAHGPGEPYQTPAQKAFKIG